MIEKKEKNLELFRVSKIAVLSFLISLAFCGFSIGLTIFNRANVERLQTEQLIYEKSLRINGVISQLLHKTQILSYLVIQSDGEIENFENIAASIVSSDPAILNVLVAPGGIVTHAYTRDGSQALIGWDFFADFDGNVEAARAFESKQLVMAGPFIGAQREMILAGRLPIFLNSTDGGQELWGLVSVTLRFPDALDGAELDILRTQRLSYELWRINPDTDEKQVIVECTEYFKPNSNYTEKHIQILNADWYLKVSPIRQWYSHPENIILIIAGIFISLLVFFVVQNNFKLSKMQNKLESLARTDVLTDIYNRRFFMEISQINIEKAQRTNEKCYVVLFDLDKFKSVNDTYGHLIGDKVLIETAMRVKSVIRPFDVFARYGGEEFIIFVSGTDDDGMDKMTERIRLSFCDKNFEYKNLSFGISASFGISKIGERGLEKAIQQADEALYEAKEQGRNRVVFHKD
jgi:diguanylate cyclase (GGDEF)-like protein